MHTLLDNYFNTEILARYLPSLLAGFWMTIQVAIVTIIVQIFAQYL